VTESLCDSTDFLWLDLEHSPISLESLQAHLSASRAGGTPILVRVQWIQRGGDCGFMIRAADAVYENIRGRLTE
jgi:2-keto-3-deoxy-L-rhamnonate aldolase RhmA